MLQTVRQILMRVLIRGTGDHEKDAIHRSGHSVGGIGLIDTGLFITMWWGSHEVFAKVLAVKSFDCSQETQQRKSMLYSRLYTKDG